LRACAARLDIAASQCRHTLDGDGSIVAPIAYPPPPSGQQNPQLQQHSSTLAPHPVPTPERRTCRDLFDARMHSNLSTDRRGGYSEKSDLSFPSAAYRRTLAQLERFARDRSATILLEGESGTGKSTLARFVHERSPRASRPFQPVVLSTIEDPLAGSELFGHVVGAFTDARQSRAGQFASANGGTVFLDEIGKASMAVQYKLLDVVERRDFRPIGSDRDTRVDIRLVAASNVPLEKEVATGRFLPDLHARLCAFRVRVPALRERRADIPLLVAQSVAAHARRCGYGAPPTVHPALMDALQRAEWPNNLRQLDSSLHRIIVDADGATELTLDHCEDESLGLWELARADRRLTPERIAEAIEREGSVSAAARHLKVDRSTLHRHQRRMREELRDDHQTRNDA
jgi:DNA-binding NtrC family response regulator